MSEDDDRSIADLFPLDGDEGPAPRASEEALDAAVARAMAAVPSIGSGASGESSAGQGAAAGPGAAGTGAAGLGVAVTTGAVLAIGVAIAALWAAPPLATTHEPDASERTTHEETGGARETHVAPEVARIAPAPSEAESPEIAGEIVEAPASSAQPGPRRASTPTRETRTTEDWLAAANTLRGERRWREAEAAYVAAVEAAPSSRSAYVARLSAAALRLEHLGDPRGALALYTLAADADGELDAPAELGVARSHRALGHTTEERRALERLLEAHPDSPLAAAATRRLAELEAPTTETPR